jgi:hypothetical protein
MGAASPVDGSQAPPHRQRVTTSTVGLLYARTADKGSSRKLSTHEKSRGYYTPACRRNPLLMELLTTLACS